MENEIIKRDLIWIAVAAVAIPLALSVINAQAQQADDRPRIGETTAEYNIRIARTRGDREALREAQEKANRETLRESQEKAEKAHRDALLESQAHRDALRESQERVGAATQRYEKAVKDFDRTIKDQKARAYAPVRSDAIDCLSAPAPGGRPPTGLPDDMKTNACNVAFSQKCALHPG
jgi:Skp family chaperone for outer membrane proteins